MNFLKITVSGILMAMLCFAPSGCSKKKEPMIRITGSTTILPFMKRVSDIYSGKRKTKIQVGSGGSMKGIKDLIAGKCDVAMCSSPIPDEILAYAVSKGIRIKGFSFAFDMIVPIVHPSNPINNLSIEQLAKIYTGKIDSWAAVGGRAAAIGVVARASTSGTGEVWKRNVLRSSRLKENCIVQHSNSGVLAHVAEHPDAIGYVSFAILNHEVKPLSVNDVAPTTDNANKGRYPVIRQLSLYVDEKKLSYPLKSLIVFVLSDKGRQMAKESGFIPRDAPK